MCAPPTPEPAPLDRADLLAQLGNAVGLVAKEDQIVWAIFGVFWAANVLLLGALFVTGRLPDDTVGALISSAGVILCVVWSLIEARAIHFLAFYEAVHSSLEDMLFSGHPSVALGRRLNDKTFKAAGHTTIRVRIIMKVSSIGSAIAWLVAAVLFISAAIRS